MKLSMWSMRPQLAVDLGTANTVIFRRGEGVVLFEPSVVAIDERTGDVQAVGSQARQMIGRTPAHIRATRPLRHGVIADFEMTEQMLRHFIRRVLGRAHSRTHVMVCVPSGITPVERSAVEEATLAAGAAHASLIDEPLAAAIGADLPVAESVGSLILDIGGRGGMLVGGGALLPGIDELIRRQTGLEVKIDDEPLTTVARGAGKALEELESIQPRRAVNRSRRPR